MKKLSKEDLWEQVKSKTPKEMKSAAEEVPSLLPLQSDVPEQEEGGQHSGTAQMEEPETKENTSPELSVTEPTTTEEPSSTTSETEENSPQQEVLDTVEKEGGEIKTVVMESAPQEKAIAEVKPRDFHLDRAEPLSSDSFPNTTGLGGNRIPATIPNLDHMLASYGINVRYNVIKKKLQVNVPGLVGASDNLENSALSQVVSLATLNTMSFGQIPSFLEAIGNRRPYNPVVDWIKSKPWDGVDRLGPFCDTLIQRYVVIALARCVPFGRS